MCCVGKVATLDVLQKRGWSLANRCLFCESAEENLNHLILHCNFTSKVWSHFAQALGFSLVQPANLINLMRCWKSFCWKLKPFVSALPQAISWAIWSERNNRVFRDQVSSANTICSRVVEMIFRWVDVVAIASKEDCYQWKRMCKLRTHPP
ncbi:hypothetical protein LINGRAHAP2_LOCUS7334 [Linum grandiflorum]